MRTARAILLAILVGSPLAAHAQATGAVGGVVVDGISREPVGGVLVTLGGLDPVLTNDAGVFVLLRVPLGEQELRFEHLAYGTHTQTLLVEGGREIALEIGLTAQAMQLSPLIVEAVSELGERRVSSGHVINEVRVAEIDRAAIEGLTLSQLLQNTMPGVMVRQSTSGAICISYRAVRTNSRGGCNALTVVLDGVPMSTAAFLDVSLRLADVERMEVLSPGQAGVRYGMLAGQSVLVIETKRGQGPRQSDLSRLLPPFDWSDEAEPYPWWQVFGSAFLANAVGVGIGLVLADHCFWTPEEATLFALRTRCRGAATLGAGLLSVGLPALGGTLAARRYGRTDRSHGRVIPSSVMAGMILTGGYLMVIEGEGGARTTGAVVLSLGVPVVLTLADRVFRILR